MKNQKTVLTELEPILGLETFAVKPTTETMLELEPGGAIVHHDGNAVEVEKSVVPQLLSRMGIPKRLYENLTLETIDAIASELFPAVEPFVIITKQGHGVAMLESASHLPVQPKVVLDALDEAVPDGEVARTMAVKEDCYARLEVVGAQEQAIKAGDLVRAGVMVNFSPIGTIEPAVQAYTSRLVCTNGATDMRVYRKWRHSGDTGNGDGKFDEWMANSIRDAVESFEHIVEHYRSLSDHAVAPEDRAAILDTLLREAALGKAANDAIRARAIEMPPENAWDMLNLLTYATTHIVEDPKKIGWGMWIASDFAQRESYLKTCPTCHRSMD